MAVPERDSVVEFQIAKHKTVGAGKPSPLEVSVAEAVRKSNHIASRIEGSRLPRVRVCNETFMFMHGSHIGNKVLKSRVGQALLREQND